jgi:signal transduction histidine kinase/FixJ family two-component response regulator
VNKRLLAAGCLVFLLPRLALAAQGSSLFSGATPELIGALAALLLVLCWLWAKLRRCRLEKQDALNQVRRLQIMIDHAPLPIVQLDGALRVTAANPAACSLLTQTPLLGCDLVQLAPELANHPEVAALQATEPVSPSLQKQTDGANEYFQLLAVDGQSMGIWYGRPVLKKISSAEESANRMKSEFIANINHEVRTPMNAIIGYTEMLANSKLEAKEKRFVSIIHKSSMALVSIFNDIMELSKIDSGGLQIMPSSVRLISIINEVEGLFKDLAEEKGLHFHCRMAKHLPRSFVVDGVRLKQVLQNLVSNAIKFTSEGLVELLVDGAPSSQKGGGYDLRFTVHDSGIGIPVGDQEKIFELFRQREDTIAKQYGGVGLGLTLCSRLVTMMGGRIDLSSKEGEGARFTVFLNGVRVAEHTLVDPPADSGGAAPARQQEVAILVVDDVDLIKDVFVDFFQDSPYKVFTANNGEEALPLALNEKPGLIFMDLNLSGTDGRSVTEELRRHPETASIPVVVMTGEMLEEEDYKPLFDDFLQKPFRLDVLKEIVARYAQVAVVENTPPSEDAQEVEELAFLACVSEVWNQDLEQLRRKAAGSGSLADAASLGIAIGQLGKLKDQPVLSALGNDLLLFANEPNILGVDRLLAKLSRVVNRKEP